jgi:NADH dehydrogenase
VELAFGDLKEPDSIRAACEGASAVISTASSTLSRQPGDSIATVDLQGQLDLVRAAKDAGASHLTFVSIPRSPVRESPLTRAKYRVEAELEDSGMPYTILAANYFMEVWLSPALGFDYPNRKAVVFGDGRQLMSWVSYEDVAGFAVQCAETNAAHNRILEIGGPEDLSPLDVVRTFEGSAGGPFEVQHVPEDALLAQLENTADPLSETFCKLQLEYLHGCLMNTSEALRMMPLRQKTVGEYAAEAISKRAAAV